MPSSRCAACTKKCAMSPRCLPCSSSASPDGRLTQSGVCAQGVTQVQIDAELSAVSAQVRLDAINALLQQQRLQPWKDKGGRYLFRDVGIEQAIKCGRRSLQWPAPISQPRTAPCRLCPVHWEWPACTAPCTARCDARHAGWLQRQKPSGALWLQVPEPEAGGADGVPADQSLQQCRCARSAAHIHASQFGQPGMSRLRRRALTYPWQYGPNIDWS